MRLDFAMLARAVAAHDGELFIHGGGIRTLHVPSLPSIAPIGLAGRVLSEPTDFGSQHELGLRVLAPDGTTVFDSPTSSFEVPDISPDDPSEVSVVIGMNVGGVRFNDVGAYTFELVLDGAAIAALRLDVHITEPASPQD